MLYFLYSSHFFHVQCHYVPVITQPWGFCLFFLIIVSLVSVCLLLVWVCIVLLLLWCFSFLKYFSVIIGVVFICLWLGIPSWLVLSCGSWSIGHLIHVKLLLNVFRVPHLHMALLQLILQVEKGYFVSIYSLFCIWLPIYELSIVIFIIWNNMGGLLNFFIKPLRHIWQFTV